MSHYVTLRHDGPFFFACWRNSPRYTEKFLQLALAHHCLLQQWGSLDGTAAPIECILMDLCMEFTPACVLMHMMRSAKSQRPVGLNDTWRHGCSTRKPKRRGKTICW